MEEGQKRGRWRCDMRRWVMGKHDPIRSFLSFPFLFLAKWYGMRMSRVFEHGTVCCDVLPLEAYVSSSPPLSPLLYSFAFPFSFPFALFSSSHWR